MRTDLLLEQFDTLVETPQDVRQLEHAILNLAVHGQLIPQDSRDEPASVLLERMAAERAQLVKQGVMPKKRKTSHVSPSEVPYQVPQGWTWVRLPQVHHNWGQKKPNRAFTYIDVSAIDKEQGIIGEDLAVIDPEDAPSRARKVVKSGTVIYSTVRPYLLNIAIVDRDFEPEPIVSTAFAVMHPLGGLLNRYIYYYLRSRPFIEFVESQMTGMAYPAISDSKLRKGLVPLPPLAEQKRIVAKVESLLALCDALAGEVAAGEEVRGRLLQAVLNGGGERP